MFLAFIGNYKRKIARKKREYVVLIHDSLVHTITIVTISLQFAKISSEYCLLNFNISYWKCCFDSV